MAHDQFLRVPMKIVTESDGWGGALVRRVPVAFSRTCKSGRRVTRSMHMRVMSRPMGDCEGCNRAAVKLDAVGVPLCRGCWNECAVEVGE